MLSLYGPIKTVGYGIKAVLAALVLWGIWSMIGGGSIAAFILGMIWMLGALRAKPMRDYLRVASLAKKKGITTHQAQLVDALTRNFGEVAVDSGFGTSEVVPRPHIRNAIPVIGSMFPATTTVYDSTPKVVDVNITDNGVDLLVKPGMRGQDSEDLADPVACRHIAQTLQETWANDDITVTGTVHGAKCLWAVTWGPDPLEGSRDSTAQTGNTGPVIIGVDETGADVTWDPFEASHVATQGQTRSGKSVLKYTQISALAGRANIEVCGLDPTGILLGPWAEAGNQRIATPHTAGETPVYQHFLEVITGVIEEMDRRNAEDIAAKGKDKLDAEDFTPELPVLYFALEEYPGILRAAASEDSAEGRKPAERVAPKIEAAVGRLLAEGAKAGIRVDLLGQRLSAKSVDTDSRSNFGTRATMRVDNAEAVGMLHDNAHEWAPIVSRFQPGHGLIERPGLGAMRFRADYTDYQTYRRRILEGENNA